MENKKSSASIVAATIMIIIHEWNYSREGNYVTIFHITDLYNNLETSRYQDTSVY